VIIFDEGIDQEPDGPPENVNKSEMRNISETTGFAGVWDCTTFDFQARAKKSKERASETRQCLSQECIRASTTTEQRRSRLLLQIDGAIVSFETGPLSPRRSSLGCLHSVSRSAFGASALLVPVRRVCPKKEGARDSGLAKHQLFYLGESLQLQAVSVSQHRLGADCLSQEKINTSR
jgi:hypothetical protein